MLYLNGDGSVQQTIEINRNTTNIPILDDNSSFGASMAYLGDLDGPDGTAGLLAVKAFSERDEPTDNKDNVYLLYLHSDGTIEKTVRIDYKTVGGPDLVGGDSFGHTISWLGDLGSDGSSMGALVIGSPGDDTGGDGRGALHLIWLE